MRSITGAPASAANLLDYGRGGDQLRARVVDGVNSQFQFANINADAVYSTGATLTFQSSPGAFPLRTDRVQTLANGETLASARLNDRSNGRRTNKDLLGQYRCAPSYCEPYKSGN